MSTDQTRNQKAIFDEPGRLHFAALRELELKLSGTGSTFEELHANSRKVGRRERTARRAGLFSRHPRRPDDA